MYTCTVLYLSVYLKCSVLVCTHILFCSCLYTCSVLYLSVHLYCTALFTTNVHFYCTVQTVLYFSVHHYHVTLLPPGWRPLVPGGHCQLRPRPLWRQHPRGVHQVRPSLYPRSYIYVSLISALTVNSLHVWPLSGWLDTSDGSVTLSRLMEAGDIVVVMLYDCLCDHEQLIR